MNSRANVRPYNAQVLIGNWHEDRVMEQVVIIFANVSVTSDRLQEVLNDFLDKRYTGQLASQKMTEVERMSQSVGRIGRYIAENSDRVF